VFWGWPEESATPNVLAYIVALVAALVSVQIVIRFLTKLPREQDFPAPPPPPQFQSSEGAAEIVNTESR